MKSPMQRRAVLQWAALGAATQAWSVRAEPGWPNKAVTLVVPFPAGGGTDAFLGLLALNMSMGQWLCVPMMLCGALLWRHAQRASVGVVS